MDARADLAPALGRSGSHQAAAVCAALAYISGRTPAAASRPHLPRSFVGARALFGLPDAVVADRIRSLAVGCGLSGYLRLALRSAQDEPSFGGEVCGRE